MKIIVGLSGGVDSSVAAYLLKAQGYDVHGLFMVNWHDRTGTLTSSCTWEDDWDLAQMVAKKLDIPIELVDLSEKYKQRVVDYMFDEYGKGRTPNPDVLCNREIKFDEFLNVALEKGADLVATGHYCRKSEQNGVYSLLAGLDQNKDQSYFLCQLNQEQLSRALFPIGELTKPEVRKIAEEVKLPTATRKDSQGICFVGKVHLPDFLKQKLEPEKGNVIEVFSTQRIFKDQHNDRVSTDEDLIRLSAPYDFASVRGKKVGEHNGAHYYTVGQRKGLNIGGFKEPLFVLGTKTDTNIIYVGEGQDHPGLFRKGLFIKTDEVHWIREDLKIGTGEEQRFEVRIRYRQPLQQATLYSREEGIYIIFDEPQRAITPGQFAAWYHDDELIGSGVINA
ncbi:tRNA 2-thiouridine(34) synthase MnmA [Saccharicrinis sp. FJH2]|uniref:tRNA 2-thiouridine(34) synthase MnmA n=1 Tax=Saccharicrinis sp. FJH65 TaxID=3344659 RepID=UPI0035F4335F